MKKLLLFILLLPGLACAYTLEVVQGISVYSVNNEKVSSGPYELIKGQNQIAIRFDGKLREQGQKEHFQSRPYLLTFTAKADLHLMMVSNRYKTVLAAEKQGQPIFHAESNAVHIEQILLPALSKSLPYADIAGLVSHYNEKNGLYFAAGHLEKLSSTQIAKQKTAEQSKVVAQLKYWYSKATAEEISAFEKWKKAQ
ncbi:hypothetical protein CXF72_05905 [Psychromonas sp. MB-3u-54]|uniref:DUF2057 family protein n=1 Tax=Psychromonas sp. MB-3u-54 TaxID=2058319 RepID=UPI000C32ADC3|nr:DUF2057 family protein [Psychromonas sp. MB-3u-54]PKH03521.1 hypothetical protein CXF72_05905 [Psychromonas sp. MB-3u-54]